MQHPVPLAAARESLRRIANPHAIDFGSRLLGRGRGGLISFREFVAVAHEAMVERPQQTALYLAALVALDIGRTDDEDEERRTGSPSAN